MESKLISAEKGRTSQGVRGLKQYRFRNTNSYSLSHLARGAWIETWCKKYGYTTCCRRTSQGVRGLKLKVCKVSIFVIGRTSQGVRGLKPLCGRNHIRCYRSHLARGAWIETDIGLYDKIVSSSHLARGAWIETVFLLQIQLLCLSHLARGAWIETVTISPVSASQPSHLARGAWIETSPLPTTKQQQQVAPRKGCVD